MGAVRSTSAAAGSIRRTAIPGEKSPKRKAAPSTGRRLHGTRPSAPIGFPLSEQAAFRHALLAFHQRLASLAERESDRAAATLLAKAQNASGCVRRIDRDSAPRLCGRSATYVLLLQLARFGTPRVWPS
jgi:hypothetical protein